MAKWQWHLLETIGVVLLLFQRSDGLSAGSRIANGEEAAVGEFPFLVSVTYNDEHICGGFIYDAQHVVTAASCVSGRDASLLAVVAAQYHLIEFDPSEKRYDILNVYIYDYYDETLKLHDLAVLKVKGDFAFGPYVSIGYYEEVDVTIPAATIMGWGYIEDNGPLSMKLLKGTVTLTDGCTVYGEQEYQRNYMICAGDSNVDTVQPCLYDEGSPLLQGSYVIGIMSKNRGCNQMLYPTIYTRLSSYFVWLQRVVGAQPLP